MELELCWCHGWTEGLIRRAVVCLSHFSTHCWPFSEWKGIEARLERYISFRAELKCEVVRKLCRNRVLLWCANIPLFDVCSIRMHASRGTLLHMLGYRTLLGRKSTVSCVHYILLKKKVSLPKWFLCQDRFRDEGHILWWMTC